MIPLRLEHITKRFGSVVAVDDVSLTVERGSIVTVIGVSGGADRPLFLDKIVVQIICGNSLTVVVQFPTSGTGIGGGDVKHFEFYEVHNSSWLSSGDYFVVHLCDNVHEGDIFRVLDDNVTAGETRLL